MAIIVYKELGNVDTARYYLEQHDIVKAGDNYTLQAPVPLPDNVFKDIAKSYVSTKASMMGFNGLIAEHLLFCFNKLGNTTVVWYRPREKRSLNISGYPEGLAVEVPPLVFATNTKDLFIFALKEDKRPGMTTKLYQAPFFNIYADGKVCLGTAMVGTRQRTYEAEAARFERGFYMAEQSGGFIHGRTETPLIKIWTKLAASKAPFPVKELKPHSTIDTLADLIARVTGERTYQEEELDENEA